MSETLEYTCDPKPRPENTIQVQPMYHLHISIICPHCRQETLTPHPAMSAKTSPLSGVLIPLRCVCCNITQYTWLQFAEAELNPLQEADSSPF
ncbi:MAG: hypothetical protein BroJett005_31610 [Ignavibacteriota bacterium]|nr:MAG: hypothetical protein BroJett005_31610 [Ignavibacteriota bacterium]